MRRFRNAVLFVVSLAAAICGEAVLFDVMDFNPPPPKVCVKGASEAQIKEQYQNEQKSRAARLKRERADRIKAYAIQVQTAAARAVYRHHGCADVYSVLTGRAAHEFRVPARVLAAVAVVESGCNPNAVSGRNSIGFMQINPRVWGHETELTDAEFNIRLGAKILSSYIRGYGLVEGLHRYNGLGSKRHPTGLDYPIKVLAVGGIEWPSSSS